MTWPRIEQGVDLPVVYLHFAGGSAYVFLMRYVAYHLRHPGRVASRISSSHCGDRSWNGREFLGRKACEIVQTIIFT